MSYPAIWLATATVGRHRCPQKRLQTARQPPVYPNSSPDHHACNSLTPFRCPHVVHPCPSVDSGLALAVFGFLREGYSHVSDAITDLQEVGSPNMAGVNATFTLMGLLVLAFSVGLYRGAGPGRWVKVGSLLVFVVALGHVIGSVFPDDYSCPSPGCNSWAANGHTVGGFMEVFTIPLAVLVFSRGLGRDTVWRPYRTYSLVTGIVAFALLALFFASASADTSPLGRLGGAIQRLYFASWFVWIELMAIKLFRLSGRSLTGPS